MTEVFVPGPYTCGDYDTSTEYFNPADPDPDTKTLYCLLRNVFGGLEIGLCIFGIVGNVLSFLVLLTSKDKMSSYIILTNLAAYDCLLLLSHMMLVALPKLIIAGHWTVLTSNVVGPIMFPIYMISLAGSIYATLAITTERYIAVAFPLKASLWLTSKRTRGVCIVIFLWSIFFQLPRMLGVIPVTYIEPSTNSTWIRMGPWVDFLKNDMIRTVIYGYLNSIFKTFLPLLLVLVLNTLMIIAVWKQKRALLSSSSRLRHQKQSRLTTVVLAIISVFLVSQILTCTQLLVVALGWRDRCGLVCFILDECVSLALIINSALNFLFYCLIGSRFRKDLRKLCLKG